MITFSSIIKFLMSAKSPTEEQEFLRRVSDMSIDDDEPQDRRATLMADDEEIGEYPPWVSVALHRPYPLADDGLDARRYAHFTEIYDNPWDDSPESRVNWKEEGF